MRPKIPSPRPAAAPSVRQEAVLNPGEAAAGLPKILQRLALGPKPAFAFWTARNAGQTPAEVPCPAELSRCIRFARQCTTSLRSPSISLSTPTFHGEKGSSTRGFRQDGARRTLAIHSTASSPFRPTLRVFRRTRRRARGRAYQNPACCEGSAKRQAQPEGFDLPAIPPRPAPLLLLAPPLVAVIPPEPPAPAAPPSGTAGSVRTSPKTRLVILRAGRAIVADAIGPTEAQFSVAEVR